MGCGFAMMFSISNVEFWEEFVGSGRTIVGSRGMGFVCLIMFLILIIYLIYSS